ncbi:MAG: hypothetical protein ACI37U_06830 [Bacteroides sp.]
MKSMETVNSFFGSGALSVREDVIAFHHKQHPRGAANYWLAMGEGVFRLRDGQLDTVARGMFANCIIRGADGTLLFGTRKGVKTLTPHNENNNHRTLLPLLPHNVVCGHYDADAKRLWLGNTMRGLSL